MLPGQAQDLVFTYVVVLDDVGAKVDEQLKSKLEPTYKLETSPGNFQWGYALRSGAEPARAAALIEGLANAGLTDNGAKRADRIMRLPGSLNDKYGEPFYARLVEWHPERRFFLSQIAVGLDVTPTDVKPLPTITPLAPGETDAVFEWLMSRGLVIQGPNPRGWYAVHCPWEGEHTGDVNRGTDYHPGKPGAFKCLHGHCGGRNTAVLKDWIKEQDPTADLGLIDRESLQRLAKRLGAHLEEPPEEGLFPIPPHFDPSALTLARQLASSLPTVMPAHLPDFDRTIADRPRPSQSTTEPKVHAVIERIGMRIRYNALLQQPEIDFPEIENFCAADDKTNAGFAVLEHKCAGAGMTSHRVIRAGLLSAALRQEYQPAADWINSIAWDGVDRLPALFDTLVLRNKALAPWKEVAVRRWLLQTVAAIRNYELGPEAVSVGHVLVLQGKQGNGKSEWIGSLMPAPFVSLGMSLKLDTNERDAVRRVTRTPITELGEIDGSFRRSDTAALKNFLTTKIDTYRLPYATTEISRPRGTSFAATVNPHGFLIDKTGERRFWPLAVDRCNHTHKIDMQQVWAQVWALREAGEQFWLTDEEKVLHARASAEHHAESDVGYIVEELVARRRKFMKKDWIVANAKELARHFGLKPMMVTYTDLYDALEREGFKRATRDGKRGMRIPPYTSPLTPGQQERFRELIDAPKKTK